MEELEKFFEQNKNLFYSLMFLSFLPVLTSSALLYYLSSIESVIKAPSVSIIVYLILGGAFSMALGVAPTSIIGLVCGYIYGFDSFPYFAFTYAFACSIGYFGFQFFDNGNLVQKLLEMPKVKIFWKKKDRFNWSLVFFTRLTPVMPFAVTNIVLAACKFNFPVYILGSIGGMLPRAAIFFWFGTEAHNLTEAIKGTDGDYTRTIVTACFSLLGLGALSLISKKIWKEDDTNLEILN